MITIQTVRIYKIFFICTLLFGLFSVCEAAVLKLSPSTGVYTVNQTFTVQVRIDTGGSPINAAEGTLKFDPQKLSVVSIAKGSIFNLWTADPSFSNTAGTITFGGGSPSGYTGSAGTILSAVFRTKTAGKTNVSFVSGSVLAADGRGTNVLSSMGSAAFTLLASEAVAEPEIVEYVAPANTPAAPIIQSSSHQDESLWYAKKEVALFWDVPVDATGVRTLLDSSPGSIPTKVYESPIDSITIPDLDEGVSYFHLQFRNANGWGRVSHFRIGVDTEKPISFDINLLPDADLSNPEQTLHFDVRDKTSGVERYMIKIDEDEPYEYIDQTGSSTAALPALDPGHHSLIVEAFDRAGNSIISTYAFTILAFDKPVFTDYPEQISSDVIPVIKGQTKKNSQVMVTISSVNGNGSYIAPATFEVSSNESGEFIFIPDNKLSNGVYELAAIAIDASGSKSEQSDSIRIAVQDPGYVRIGSFLINFLSVLIPLVALILLLVFAVLFFIRKLRLIKTEVTRETQEALIVLEREFNELKGVLNKEKGDLEKSRRTKKLTRAESKLVHAVLDAMEVSKKRVKSEIEDVDDVIE